MRATRRGFLLGALAAPVFAKKTPPPRPNVVLLAADDLGAWMLGCYGNREIRTPNVDRFAQTGLRFSAMISAVPSIPAGRAALLSGQVASGGAGLASVLGGAGYQCQDTDLAGADQALGRQKAGTPFLLTVAESVFRGAGSRQAGDYSATGFETVGWDPSAAVQDPIPRLREAAGAITGFDGAFGELVNTVRKRNLLENTLLILTSGAGRSLGQHGLWDSGTMYEQCVAVPMIWSWLGRVAPGNSRAEVASTLGLLPALCQLAGAAPPAGACGRSFLPLAMGTPLPKKQPWLNTACARLDGAGMARDHRYKLVAHADGKGELYDLTVDRREKVNQHGNPQFLSVKTRLAAEWDAWKKRCGA
jgi:arylsulfatase A-like enzyme